MRVFRTIQDTAARMVSHRIDLEQKLKNARRLVQEDSKQARNNQMQRKTDSADSIINTLDSMFTESFNKAFAVIEEKKRLLIEKRAWIVNDSFYLLRGNEIIGQCIGQANVVSDSQISCLLELLDHPGALQIVWKNVRSHDSAHWTEPEHSEKKKVYDYYKAVLLPYEMQKKVLINKAGGSYNTSEWNSIISPWEITEDHFTDVYDKVQRNRTVSLRDLRRSELYVEQKIEEIIFCYYADTLLVDILDACAYLDEKISFLRSEMFDKLAQMKKQLKIDDVNGCREEAGPEQADETNEIIIGIKKEITDYMQSAEVQGLFASIDALKKEASVSGDEWSEFTPSTSMPNKLYLNEISVEIPNLGKAGSPVTTVGVPFGLDLFQSNILILTGSEAESVKGRAKNLEARRILSHLIRTVPAAYNNYCVFDPLYKGVSVGRLIDLLNVGSLELQFHVATSEESGADVLTCKEMKKQLRVQLPNIIRFLGGKYNSLFEHNLITGDYDIPYTWYVDFNFTDKISDSDKENLFELFASAQVAGYSFMFVTDDTGANVIRELANKFPEICVTHIDCDTKTYTQGDIQISDVVYTDWSHFEETVLHSFINGIKKYYEDGVQIDNRLDVVFENNQIIPRSAEHKIDIPMALNNKGKLVSLVLGDEAGVHGFVSGSTKSGKSSLLYSVVVSACLHYTPEDLEIWLLDYKMTDFKLFEQARMPHIKLISVTHDPEFTYSILDKIEAEMARRAALFERYPGVKDFEGYYKHHNEPDYVNIPRLLIVVDEFHRMSQHVFEAYEYRTMIENLLREGRSFGINCLLADQNFTGLKGLSDEAKGQIGIRIAMKNDNRDDLMNTLSVDRSLYTENLKRTISLLGAGDFIMKSYVYNKRGEKVDIRLDKFKSIWTQEGDLFPISAALSEKYADGYNENEMVYINTLTKPMWNHVKLDVYESANPIKKNSKRFYLGNGATLQPCFNIDLRAQTNENLSVLGGDASQRWELLTSVLRSCDRGGYKLYVFADDNSEIMDSYYEEIKNLCDWIPDAELVVDYKDWCTKLVALEKRIDDRLNDENIVCVFIGMKNAYDNFSIMPERIIEAKPSNTTQKLTKYMSVIEQMKMEAMTAKQVDADEGRVIPKQAEFNVIPIIQKMIVHGPVCRIHSVVEFAVYDEFKQILSVDRFKNRIAFKMDNDSDGNYSYLGSIKAADKFEKNAKYAFYKDGNKLRKLIPYQKSGG